MPLVFLTTTAQPGVTLVGGDGRDTVSYAGTHSRPIIASLETGRASWVETASNVGVTDTLIGIENLIGASNNDTLTGNSADNVLDPGAGFTNTLTGGAGNDTYIVSTQTGVTISDSSGVDRLHFLLPESREIAPAHINFGRLGVQPHLGFQAFDDRFDGIVTGQITDHFAGNPIEEVAFQRNGVTVVYTLQQGETPTHGGSGNDMILGTGGSDTIRGFAGDDAIYGSPQVGPSGFGIDHLSGDDGDDNLQGAGYLSGGRGDDVLVGLGFDDTLDGGEGNDELEVNGGEENDVLEVNAGGTLIGGTGDDSYGVQSISTSVIIRDVHGADILGLGEFGAANIASMDISGSNLVITRRSMSFAHEVGQITLEGQFNPTTSERIEFVSFDGDDVPDLKHIATSHVGTALGDMLVGVDGFDVHGGDGDDIISRGDANIVEGGNGDDLLLAESASGAAFRGGTGIDIVSYLGSTEGISVSRDFLDTSRLRVQGVADVSGNFLDSLEGIEVVIGSRFSDFFEMDGDVTAGTSTTYVGGNGSDVFDLSEFTVRAENGVFIAAHLPNFADIGAGDILNLTDASIFGTGVFSGSIHFMSEAFDGTNAGVMPSQAYFVIDANDQLYFDSDSTTPGYTVIAGVQDGAFAGAGTPTINLNPP
jgi:hypothetical protein